MKQQCVAMIKITVECASDLNISLHCIISGDCVRLVHAGCFQTAFTGSGKVGRSESVFPRINFHTTLNLVHSQVICLARLLKSHHSVIYVMSDNK